MKKNRLLFGALAAAFAVQLLAGCNAVPNEEKLNIADIEVYTNGAPTEMSITLTGDKDKISYEYDEFAITIEDGKLVCYKAGTYTVKATYKDQVSEFTVTCRDAFKVDDMYAWKDYPAAEISATVYIDGASADDIEYTCTSNILTIDDGLVTALAAGATEVTASLKGYETTFIVNCKEIDKVGDQSFYMWDGSWNWNNKATNGRARYDKEGTDGKTTLFMGDSFFDVDFFTLFDEFYGDYDALCLGIGGTTSNQWEMFFNNVDTYYAGRYGQYSGIQPKNIVFQLGNNNIYNDNASAKDVIEDLERFFTFIHAQMPDTKLYYFGVTPRSAAMATYTTTVKTVTAEMFKFCANKDWIVCLDTTDKMTADKLKDTIHPYPEAYSIFVDALEEAGLELEPRG